MYIDELTQDLRGGPAVPSIRLDAVDSIIAGAARIRRRRNRMAVVASISAVFLAVAVIVGGSTMLGSRPGPGAGPVARSVSTPVGTVLSTSTGSTTPPRTTVAHSVAGNAVATTRSKSSSPLVPLLSPPSRVISGSSTVTSTERSSTEQPKTQQSTTQQSGTQQSGTQQSGQPNTGSTTTAAHTPDSAAAPDTSGTGVLHLDSFRLPSGNIGCRMTTGKHGPQAVCAIGEFDGTVCQPGWNHQLTIDIAGASYCEQGPVVAVPAGPMLKYGQANVAGGIVCTSNEATGLSCTSPFDGVAFWVNRSALGAQPGEGGGAAAHLQNGAGSPPVVPITGSGTYFGSADLSVLCKVALTSPSNAAVTCAPNRAGSIAGADCPAAGQAAQLDLVSAGVSSTHFCGVSMNGDGLPDVIAALTGKIIAGTVFTINHGKCQAEADRVICQAGGTGFQMTAAGYADLGSEAPATTVARSAYLDGSHLLPGLHVQNGSGTCGTAADAVRADEVVCRVDGGATVFPCFVFPNHLGAACANGKPDSGQVLLLTGVRFTSAAFPGLPAVDPATRPWFLQLADGTSCARPGGPRSTGTGQSITFDCGSSTSYLLGEPDASDSTWTVRKYPASGDAPAQTVSVSAAWY